MVAQRDRLRESVRVLTEGMAVDEQRIAQEIAILADRLDVQEELQRFASHIAAFRSALAQNSGEPVGKRLGFLLQEMLREANTTGSKANDGAMLQDVVTIKEELERIREQVEHLEGLRFRSSCRHRLVAARRQSPGCCSSDVRTSVIPCRVRPGHHGRVRRTARTTSF